MPGVAHPRCEIFATVDGFRAWRRRLPGSASIALLITKGAIHKGHLVLLRSARRIRTCSHVVVLVHADESLFASADEMALFPCDRELDQQLLAASGLVDAALVPAKVSDLYSGGPMRGATVCFDPGRVDGVAQSVIDARATSGFLTLVLKMLNVVEPAALVMGLNDLVRCRLVQMLLHDLHARCEVVAFPAVREDGRAPAGARSFATVDPDGTQLLVSPGRSLPPSPGLAASIKSFFSPRLASSPPIETRPATAEELMQSHRRALAAGVPFSWRLVHLSPDALRALHEVFHALVAIIQAYSEGRETCAAELRALAVRKLEALAPTVELVALRVVDPLRLTETQAVHPVVGAFVVVVVRVHVGPGRWIDVRDNVNLGPVRAPGDRSVLDSFHV